MLCQPLVCCEGLVKQTWARHLQTSVVPNHAGDVGLHALTDAILGALCLPDIGQLFPDTDPNWKGANSDTFIKQAVRLRDGSSAKPTCMLLPCVRSSC